MSRLYDIDVSVDDDDDLGDHVAILLEWAIDDDDDETAETYAACRYIVTALARVAATAADQIGYERQEHGCGPQRYMIEFGRIWRDLGTRCGIDVEGLIDLREPYVCITVPRASRDDWLARISGWFSDLSRVDQATSWQECSEVQA